MRIIYGVYYIIETLVIISQFYSCHVFHLTLYMYIHCYAESLGSHSEQLARLEAINDIIKDIYNFTASLTTFIFLRYSNWTSRVYGGGDRHTFNTQHHNLPHSLPTPSKLPYKMVSQRDRDLLRDDLRQRGTKLSTADREKLLKTYLPNPAELPNRSRASTATSERRKTRKKPIRSFIKSQLHHLVYAVTHIIFGIVVRLLQAYHAVVDRVFAIVYHHHRTPELIRKDVRGLKRLPQHLSTILTLRKEDDALAVLMDEVAELAAWSSCAGIPQLSIYEKTGKNGRRKRKDGHISLLLTPPHMFDTVY